MRRPLLWLFSGIVAIGGLATTAQADPGWTTNRAPGLYRAAHVRSIAPPVHYDYYQHGNHFDAVPHYGPHYQPPHRHHHHAYRPAYPGYGPSYGGYAPGYPGSHGGVYLPGINVQW